MLPPLRIAFLIALLVMLAGCNSPPLAPNTPDIPTDVAPTFPSPVFNPTPTQSVAVATNTPEPVATTISYDSQWQAIKPGIEFARLQGRVGKADELLLVMRIDLRQASLRVIYEPQTPRTVHEWQTHTGADFVINAGFFDEANRVTGLLIVDGQAFGRSYRGFGGMFSLRGDKPSLQWLRTQPYRPDPAITQAVQSFPMLVMDAQRVDGISDNGERNRRSFIALDGDGHLLLGVTQMAQWTLNHLADFLVASPELRVIHALNLDGGASTGLWMSGVFEGASMNSLEPVPSVIVIATN